MPDYHAGYRPVGPPSDDTQLAFWTLEQVIDDQSFDPERVTERSCSHRIFGIASTLRRFIANYKSGSLPWYQCSIKSAGSGTLVCIATMLIPHLMSGPTDLWVDAARSTMMTHNDSASIAASIPFVNPLWSLLQMDGPPQPGWWLETYAEVARGLEDDETYSLRGGDLIDHRGTLWRLVQERVCEAHRKGLSVLEACNAWYSGAYLLEMMPCVIYMLTQFGHDPEEAIVRAVNDTRDNDTIAAIVGAAVDALHGKEDIAKRWITNRAGRTSDCDDGRIFALMTEAQRLWR